MTPSAPETAPTDLSGRTAVVTGGARGLGYAIAQRLWQCGAGITVLDLAGTIDGATLPDDWTTEAIDLLHPDVEDVMTAIAARSGHVDVLIANAGLVPPWRRIVDLNLTEWDRVFRVNVAGVALTLKCFAPALARSRTASAILMASINAYRAHPAQALYTASKHAVLGLMRAAALDLGKDGIRVNALAPGPIATDALMERIDARHAQGGPAPAAALESFAQETSLGRMATTAQVADAALFLAGDGSLGMTGTLLPIECGLSP